MVDSYNLYLIGKDYYNKGFYLLAADLMKEAIKHCPDQSWAINLKIVLADSLRILKRWDEAIEVYNEIGEYGTIGNIFLYLGKDDESIKWYELVKQRKSYIYYKYPQVLFLNGKCLEALDLICERYHVESKNTLIENNFPSKTELEFILLCFQKAYDFHKYINQEKIHQIELIDTLDNIIQNINNQSYEKHQGLLRSVIKCFGNLPTTIINLEKISTDKFLVKAKAKMLRIYQNKIWCLNEISEQNIYSPKGLVHKIVNDEKYAAEKLHEITDELMSKVNGKPYYNWYDYVEKKNGEKENIDGIDIVKYFNYFLPRLTIVRLFEEEVINYLNDKITTFGKENNETLCEYLANYLHVPANFYEKSDSIMFNLCLGVDNYLKQTLGLSDLNEKWIKEFAMVKLFYKWFEGFKQLTQASPVWLKPQRLDLFIPDLKLAIEYQGEQHFMPIELFGGEEGFKTRKESDERKKKLCEANGINLEYINYYDDLLEKVKEIYFKYYPDIKANKSN